jgi:hypothetical protein
VCANSLLCRMLLCHAISWDRICLLVLAVGGGASQGINVSPVTDPSSPEVSEVQIIECTCPADCTGGVMLSWYGIRL